jgi:hypothetical protein
MHHVNFPSIMTDVSTAAATAAAAVEAVDTAAVESSSTACAALLAWVKAAAKSAEVAAAKRAEDEVLSLLCYHYYTWRYCASCYIFMSASITSCTCVRCVRIG